MLRKIINNGVFFSFFPQRLSEAFSEDLQHASVYCYLSLRFYLILFFLMEMHSVCTVIVLNM